MGFRGSKNSGDMPSTRMFWLVIISPTQGQRRSNQRVLCRRSRLLLEKLAQSSDYADLAGRLDQPIGRPPRQTRTLRTGTDRLRITRFGYHHHHRHGPRTEVDRVQPKKRTTLIFLSFRSTHVGGPFLPFSNHKKLPNFLQSIHFKENMISHLTCPENSFQNYQSWRPPAVFPCSDAESDAPHSGCSFSFLKK
jgi:hypothetical protein